MAEVKEEGQKSEAETLDGSVSTKVGENQQRMFDQDTQVYQLVLGKMPDGTYALIITNPGFDVYEAIEE